MGQVKDLTSFGVSNFFPDGRPTGRAKAHGAHSKGEESKELAGATRALWRGLTELGTHKRQPRGERSAHGSAGRSPLWTANALCARTTAISTPRKRKRAYRTAFHSTGLHSTCAQQHGHPPTHSLTRSLFITRTLCAKGPVIEVRSALAVSLVSKEFRSSHHVSCHCMLQETSLAGLRALRIGRTSRPQQRCSAESVLTCPQRMWHSCN